MNNEYKKFFEGYHVLKIFQYDMMYSFDSLPQLSLLVCPLDEIPCPHRAVE